MKEPEVIKKLMKLIEEQTIEPKKKCKHEIESNMVPAYCRKCGKDMSEPKKKELVEDSWEVQFDNLFYTTQPVKEFIRDLVRQVEKKARKDERKRILEWMIKNFEKDNDQFGGIVIYEDLKEYLSSLNQSNN